MGFKIIGRKNGKKTVSDNPENDATKVTNALEFLTEAEPSAAIKGSTVRFMWNPRNRHFTMLGSRRSRKKN